MREVFFLIGRGGALLFADASDDPTQLPDSERRWRAIWRHRDEIESLAHSHPVGPLAFSEEDRTTMSALEAALGKVLTFSVIAPDGMLSRTGGDEQQIHDEPWWAPLLRLASGIEPSGAPPPRPRK
jgi:hypothetical protein